MATRRNDHSYVKRRDALKRKAQHLGLECHLCQGDKGPIRFDVEFTHPLAFTADHLDAVNAGGKMLGPLMPSHRSCNSSRQDKPLDEYLASRAAKQPGPTRRTTSW